MVLVKSGVVVEPNGFGDGADVVAETYVNDETQQVSMVRYRKPTPSIVLTITRGRFAADGTDYAEVIAQVLDRWEAEQQGHPVYLTIAGDVTFEVNLSSMAEPMDGTGKATFRLSTTASGTYTIRASMAGYGEASAQVEAVMV